MKIGIHHTAGSYSSRWIQYCEHHHIPYRIVNACDSDIVGQLEDCDIFMWHHFHISKDILFAKQLCFSLEQAGKIVFPDFNTGWHFDDKLGEKYLFESLGIRSAPAFVFYDRKEALGWARQCTYPKVFKLRCGAGSSNVLLVRTQKKAEHFIKKAFGRGFSSNSMGRLINSIRLYQSGTGSIWDIFKTLGRLLIVPPDIRILPRQKGYAYFQEFIPNDGYDIRVEIIGGKAIACARFARKNDFRASGGHLNFPNHPLVTVDAIRFAFGIYDRLKCQSCAMDIVRDNRTGELFLIEVSYCFGVDPDEFDHGYWDRDGNLHREPFNGLDWMVESVVASYRNREEEA